MCTVTIVLIDRSKRKRGVVVMRRKNVLISSFICLTFVTIITIAFLHMHIVPDLRYIMISMSAILCLEGH